MAAINGVMEHNSESWAASAHLGKRKRSASPEKKLDINGEDASAVQQTLRRKLQLLSSSGPLSSLLKHSLPSNDTHPPDSKRLRLSSAPPEDDTIEKRISSDFYTSIDQVRRDLSRLQNTISSEASHVSVNGDAHEPSVSSKSLHEAAAKFAEVLSSDDTDVTKKNSSSTHDEPTHRTGQVITLRSQTEKGTQLLYSGLQIQDRKTGTINAVDGRLLPNGFDLTDPATIDTGMLAPPKDRRLFGDVFRPHSSLKPLEMPRSRGTAFRGNVLGFSNETTLEKSTALNRHDYKFQQLPVSSWLSYKLSDQQSTRKSRGRSLAQGDLRAALIANDVASQDSEDATTLFKKAFSSFAPTADTSKAVVSERDRDRQWWSKYGSRKLRTIFRSVPTEKELTDATNERHDNIDDDFAEVVSNFQPEEQEDTSTSTDDPENVDDVLAEVSELLETLHSYQHIRSLDTRAAIGASKPSSAEFDSYELLRSQLAILIASLPPFAVAKLDGDKLEDLNISANILVDTIDYRGTAQPDEYTLSRYRAAQPAAAAAPPRPQQPTHTQPRPTYQTPAMPRYNTNNNLSAYAQNLGIAAARYTQSTNYQTPNTIQRPFQQSPFQSTSGTYSSQPTIQQFQRPIPTANGYGSYTAGTATNQGGGLNTGTGTGTSQPQTQPPTPTQTQTQPQPQTQTPLQSQTQPASQPRYQVNAQRKMSYETSSNANTPGSGVRSASPTNGVVNGQVGQGGGSGYQRPYQQQSHSPGVGVGAVNGAVSGGSGS